MEPRRANPPAPPASPDAIAAWLAVIAALIVSIVVVGGITRLTESGVSITAWQPVSGVLPPLTEAQWQAEFAAYQRIPQYIEVTGPAGMTLAQYKQIFFWEWLHRLLARSIGAAFALPLAWFWMRGMVPSGFKPRLIGLLALGGLQGAIGWWMVKSGLVHDVRVDHLRLAAHLIAALVTLAGVTWTLLDMRALRRGAAPARITGFGAAALGVLLGQLVWGAFTAGLRAGVVAGSGWGNWRAWPRMDGRWFPAGVDWSRGALHALTADPFLVHFVHRWWAWVVVVVLVALARLARPRARIVSIAIHTAFGTQVLLGIATVWSGVALWLAVLHQLTGALLVMATVWGAHVLGSAAPVRAAR